ncbi:hypothetical protein PYW07_002824 [Mythimna separata]|uniref:Peptidase M12A domain-containing protein n=1 Tax=Mythimna separata TaxID=271217 RepID=A0AAD7YGL1_MYTSE|nr:hypothetical protein PYW07_002824 [Mythimna separata]
MARIHITRRHNGNWIINLSVLLCNLNIIISKSCNSNNETIEGLPENWPCEWNSGVIPFAFNFYSIGLKRLMSIVKRAHSYIERRSCLKFIELNPLKAAVKTNLTYLYYNFSGVLENCCLRYFHNPRGRRMVLITPVCSLPSEVAHVALHGMGLVHKKRESFNEAHARALLFSSECHDVEQKMMLFDKKTI